jgi:hypothetical protein
MKVLVRWVLRPATVLPVVLVLVPNHDELLETLYT